MISALESLERLREGNRRFMSQAESRSALESRTRRNDLVAGQEPFAVILGCSDSRVPAEIVFDQGLGDLFVVRVAGNVAAPSQVESVEFAVSRLGPRLVVVLGHSMCGAIQATLEVLERPEEDRPPDLGAIVGRVRPSVEPLLETDLRRNREELVSRAVRANIRTSADHLRRRSPVLTSMVDSEGLLIVGAEYSLQTGFVDFFDGWPGTV
jgi:carbonic anhydrase